MSNMPRYTGTLKWFNPTSGYGFIAPDEVVPGLANGTDIFVHTTAMIAVPEASKITKDIPVTFTVGDHKGRVNAQDVRLA